MNAYLVEFLGTMFFLYVALSTANAVAIGAALALTIIVGGAASGGMFNPVVTLVMATAGKLDRAAVVPYIIAQVAGGLCALELHNRFHK